MSDSYPDHRSFVISFSSDSVGHLELLTFVGENNCNRLRETKLSLSHCLCKGNNNTSLWDTTRWASAGISWFRLISLLIVVSKDVRYDIYIWRREEGLRVSRCTIWA